MFSRRHYSLAKAWPGILAYSSSLPVQHWGFPARHLEYINIPGYFWKQTELLVMLEPSRLDHRVASSVAPGVTTVSEQNVQRNGLHGLHSCYIPGETLLRIRQTCLTRWSFLFLINLYSSGWWDTVRYPKSVQYLPQGTKIRELNTASTRLADFAGPQCSVQNPPLPQLVLES